MELFRLYAFAVSPERTVETPVHPSGGAVDATEPLRRAIDEASSLAGLEGRTHVDFQVDTSTRTSETRDLVLEFVFGQPAAASAAANRLAERLSNAMDRRSTPCLFILAAYRDEPARRVTLWTFPRDEAFQFRPGRHRPSIALLSDVFSRTSRLRKAALFEGQRRRTDFLSGRVLDFQANVAIREVADFWIARFLGCDLGIRGDAGTRLLVTSIRKAFDIVQTVSEREQLHAAVMAVRRSPTRRWSLTSFADQYLSDRLHKEFLNAAPREVRGSQFNLSLDVFDEALKFHVFHLATGVVVSSPPQEIGDSVQILGTEQKTLRCEGVIVGEKVRSRA